MLQQHRLQPLAAAQRLSNQQPVCLPQRPAACSRQVCILAQASRNSLAAGSALPYQQPENTIPAPAVAPRQQQLQQQASITAYNAPDKESPTTASSMPETAYDGGGGYSNKGTGGGGAGGGWGNNGDGSEDDDSILDMAQVEAAAAAAKVQMPADMLETAKAVGLRQSALSKYLSLQSLAFTGSLMRTVPWVRDRMIADEKYLFKVLAEVLIDSGCATVAEVRKRGDEFWKEFEFYLSDLLVGIVLDVVLVTLMAPRAVIGGRASAKAQSGLQRWLSTIPSAALEASQKGVREYTVGARFACLGVKFLEYSLAGICCGFIGQGLANSLMLLKRQIHGESEDDVAVPPLVKTALVWGLFMGVSSNLRYQAVFGLERLVDMTIAKKVPAIAYGTTVAIRFVNNVIGGENFIDMARWAGVQ
eukprot:GHRR01008653.1.p1 GENE.GHRR01008653.1~~GHRR01008653.1.p1  ORF type:complete len:418 (+),score=173.82 GHRR01008653.1:222-1475(+)